MSAFQQPPPAASSIKPAELNGSLVLIYARRFQADVVMPSGETVDGIEVELSVLDGPKAGEIENGMIFSRVLVGSLRNAIGGDPVLGRVGQGIANPGKTAPWVLTPYTDADAALATAWINARPPFTAPPAPTTSQAVTVTPTAAASAPAAATPSPAASPASGNGAPVNGMTAAAFAALPAEVQALLRQSGQVPAGV